MRPACGGYGGDAPPSARVAGVHRCVHDLLEGVPARLSRFELDHVQDLVLAVEDQVVEPEQDPLARPGIRAPPTLLSLTRAGGRILDVLGATLRNRSQGFAGGRVCDLEL